MGKQGGSVEQEEPQVSPDRNVSRLTWSRMNHAANSKENSEVFLLTASSEWSMSWSSHCPHCITWNPFENKLGFEDRHFYDSEAQKHMVQKKKCLGSPCGKALGLGRL